MIFNAIAAISRNKGIGLNNQLPWKLREDLVRFKKLTIGNRLSIIRYYICTVLKKGVPIFG